MSQVNCADVYAVHRWRSVSASHFLEMLAQQAMTLDEPAELRAQATTLDDSRCRITYLAYVRPANDFKGEGDEVGPYLMQIYEAESGKAHFFERTDVIMNHM